MSHTLPTEDGWYEAEGYFTEDAFCDVRRNGQWYEANQDGWQELSDDKMREDFLPLRRLVVAPDSEGM